MMIALKLLFASQFLWAAPRTVMLQLFEWPWESVARECETNLGPNGFSAVQVSPPSEHLSAGKNAWWERYQPISYKIISRSGTEAQFQDMVSRCHRAGVDVYADVVLNHTTAYQNGYGFGGTSFTKYNHPDFSRGDFHDCGRNGNNEIKNFKDRYEVQFCELLGLADLRTESEYVRDRLSDYLNRLLDLGVAGFRVDGAKHIPPDDIKAILSRLKRSPYIVSETFIGADEPIKVQEYVGFGDVNYFPYAFDVGGAFTSGSLSKLPQTLSFYPDSRSVVVFLENHDTQRMDNRPIPLVTQNPQVYWLAHVFMMTWPYGYPQVFSGYSFTTYDQGPPVGKDGFTSPVLDDSNGCIAPWNCEHRLGGMNELVKFRNETDRSFFASSVWHGNDSQLAYSRGTTGFVVINRAGEKLQAKIPTDLSDGVYCDLLSAKNRRKRLCPVTVRVSGGIADVNLDPMSALVLLPSRKARQ